MKQKQWCEHLDKSSKYTLLKYDFDSREVTLRVQTWVCPECGIHGSETEVVDPPVRSQTTAG